MNAQIKKIIIIAILICIDISLAFTQGYPIRNIRIIVPFSPGGTSDVFTRPLAKELSALWGHPVIIENVPGGDTTIGASKVASAPADGYTLLMTNSQPLVGNRYLFKKLPYDPDKNFIPIIMVARSGSFLITHPSFPAKNVKELVNLARNAPESIAYASTGRGAAAQLVLETLAKREKFKFNHIPYKGVPPALTALTSGEVPIAIFTPAGSGAMIRSGKLKAIAITSTTRLKLFPDIPSIVESGYPYLTYLTWFGLFAPTGTHTQIIEKIHRDAYSILKRTEFVERFISPSSLEVVANTPEEFLLNIRSDVANVAAMVTAAELHPE